MSDVTAPGSSLTEEAVMRHGHDVQDSSSQEERRLLNSVINNAAMHNG